MIGGGPTDDMVLVCQWHVSLLAGADLNDAEALAVCAHVRGALREWAKQGSADADYYLLAVEP